MKTKKLLSWLLVLSMVFSLLPGMTLTASAEDPHRHTLCVDENTCTNPDHASGHGSEVTFTPCASMPTAAGSYYLTEDVTWGAVTLNQNITLCLNGHTINGSIAVATGKTLTLCDCGSGEHTATVGTESVTYYGGRITNSSYFTTPHFSKGIYVNEKATLNMYGGNVLGCSMSGSCAGIDVYKGTLNLYGGHIFHNKCSGIIANSGTVNMYGGDVSHNGEIGIKCVNSALKICGGTITHNTYRYGAGVTFTTNINDTLYLKDCSITDNTGGGVGAEGSNSIVNVQLDGKVTIKDNVNDSNNPYNLDITYCASAVNEALVTLADTFDYENSEIGITKANSTSNPKRVPAVGSPVAFTGTDETTKALVNSSKQVNGAFFSDNSQYSIDSKDSRIYLLASGDSFAAKFDLRDGSEVTAAGESFDYNAPKWGDGETSKYTFSHWSETIDGATAVDKTGGDNADAYDAGDFETGKNYYAVWKTGTGSDANIVLTQWVDVRNNGIYFDGYKMSSSQTPADADTLRAYGMTYAPAVGTTTPIKVTMNNTVIDVQTYTPSGNDVMAMKLVLNTELEVSGENKIILSGKSTANKMLYALNAAKNLKVTGNGSLLADASGAEAVSSGCCWGAYVLSEFGLGTDVAMTAKGGKAAASGYSYAIGLSSTKTSTIDGALNLIGGACATASSVYGIDNNKSTLVIRGTLFSDSNLKCGRVQLSDSGSVVLTGAKDMTVSTAYAVAQIDSSNKVISGAVVDVTGGTKSEDGKTFTKSADETNMVLKFHQHNFTTFEAKDNTVVATCANTDGCGLTDHKITLTLTANGGTYKNAAYTATHDDATVKFADTTKATLEVKYVGKAPTSYAESTTAPTNSGSYTAKLVVTYDTNKSVTATKDFDISKANQSLAVTMNSYNYNSTPSTPSINGTIKESAAPSYYYNTTNSNEGGTKWENVTGTTLNPGTYYMYAELAATTNYNAFTTAAKAFTVNGLNFTSTDINVTGYNNAYDGQAHSISVTAPTGATVTYSTDSGAEKNYTATNPTATNVGTTTVYYKVSKTGYNDKTGNASIVITKATATTAMTTPADPFLLKAKKDATVEITLPALPTGASYGTVTNANSAFFTVGTISGGKVTVTSAKDWPKGTESKSFTVAVTGATNYNNYNITVTIAPVFKTELTVSGVSMDKESYTYGDTVGYTGTVSMKNGEDAVTGITPEYTYYAKNGESWTKLDAAPTDAGDYKLVVSIPESNEDYEGSMEIPFSIAKKSVTAPSANTNAFVYTGSEQTYFTIADNADYKLAEDSAAASQTNADTYTIKLVVKDSANYQWADGAVTEFTFTINPRVTVKDQTGAVVCNGVDTKLDGTYSLPAGTTLKPGTYQVITELGSKTITSVLVVEDGKDPETTVTIPTKEVSSEVEIKTTEGTPNITVTGLNTLANTYNPGASESISVTMTVEAKPADASSDAQAAIKAVNDAQTTKVSKFDFVDMSIVKESFINGSSNGTDDIHDAQGVLEIIVPFITSGRKDITVFRYHNDGTNPAETKVFDKLDERPTGSFADGTYFVGSGFIVVYAQFFSEYAIGYNTVSSGGGSVSNSIMVPADIEHGKLTADKTKASSGEKVTITVTPDKGYTQETLTVKDAKGNTVEVTKVNDTTYTFKMPSSKVTVEATFMEDNSMLNFFVDVFASDYYYDAVLWAAENGITDGTDTTHFSPNMGTTRAHVVTFLWRAAGCPEPKAMTSFADVEVGSYYEKAVAWALEAGVTKGTSATTFSPNSICTRAQIVTFLYRYNGVDTLNIKDNPFTDVAEGQFYYDAVLWAAENGVTSGTSATTFSPASDCLRGQVVTFLYRLLAE